MNLRDLEYFTAVADTHHFGHAARRCHVSQPTLSGQIMKLEEELGVALFERTKRSVEISPIGKQMLTHARQALEQVDVIRKLAFSQQDPMTGVLNIGIIPTLSPYLTPLILKPLRAQYPNLRLTVTEELTETLTQRLKDHDLDAALLATKIDKKQFESNPLFDEPFWLAYSQQDSQFSKKKISRQDLENSELLLLAEGHCLADQALELCQIRERSERQEIADLRASSLETLLQMVSAGYGCTLLPALAVDTPLLKSGEICLRPLTLPDAKRRIALVYRRSYPRIQTLEAFTAVVTENLPKRVECLVGPTADAK